MFPSGIRAKMDLPDGTAMALSSLHVRATEYTTGTDGIDAMPGELPAASGYTYAVDLAVDEAWTAGATNVRFNQAVPVYVENFLDFKVGAPVPAGYFDEARSAWIASDDGRIIEILSVNAQGQLEIDIDGSGLPASTAALTGLGITAEERAQLAKIYSVGQTLWRVPVKHFTPWDFNQPWGLPPNASSPNLAALRNSDKESLDDPQLQCHASTIECQNQVLREQEAVSGTSYTLNYSSSRVRDGKAGYR